MTLHGTPAHHRPVMVEQVLWGLAVRAAGRYIDCTLGDGGHASAILEAAGPEGRLLGIDLDPEAVAAGRERLAPHGAAATVIHGNFDSLEAIALDHRFVPAHGILFDLGLSSRQLDLEERGFSFQRPAPLDMRFDPERGGPAADLVNHAPVDELANIIFRLGEEPRSRRIARGIVAHRPIADTQRLADVVRRASGYHRSRTHPATRTFQALRMAVNRELENLELGLAQAVHVLEPGGRLVTIAYHSLEDRSIKEFIRDRARPSQKDGLRPVNKRVLRPSEQEVRENRRSRSARLRAAERI